MMSKINYIRKNRMYLRHCDLRIVLIFNNRKNKYEKKYYKDFYCIKCYIKSTNYKYLAYHLK